MQVVESGEWDGAVLGCWVAGLLCCVVLSLMVVRLRLSIWLAAA